MQDDIAGLRDILAQEPDNLRYCYLLAEVVRVDDGSSIEALTAPLAAAGRELSDILPLFALLDVIPDMFAGHRRRGIPADVTADTCAMFENQVQVFVDLYGHYGISTYVWWLTCFLNCRILRIGRLNFDVRTYPSPYDIFACGDELVAMPNGVTFHRSGAVLGSVGCEDPEGSFVGDVVETDAYYEGLVVDNARCRNEKRRLPRGEWRRVLTQGDPIVSVHIPTGGSFTPEACDSAIARAREIITVATALSMLSGAQVGCSTRRSKPSRAGRAILPASVTAICAFP